MNVSTPVELAASLLLGRVVYELSPECGVDGFLDLLRIHMSDCLSLLGEMFFSLIPAYVFNPFLKGLKRRLRLLVFDGFALL